MLECEAEVAQHGKRIGLHRGVVRPASPIRWITTAALGFFNGARVSREIARCLVTWLIFLVPVLVGAQERSLVSVTAGSQQRIALVIGNGSYAAAPLVNPVNDARLIARALATLGFTVEPLENASLEQMEQAVRRFGDGLAAAGERGVGVFYFAGHGLQVQGRNYLLPVGTRLEREDEVRYHALDAGLVLDKMRSAGSGTNLLLLDACRDNPLARSFRSTQTGLAQMGAPAGTLVVYATEPGATAADGAGANSPFTASLARALVQPGLELRDVILQVRRDVMEATGGRQVPWEEGAPLDRFYFTALPSAPGVQEVLAPASPFPTVVDDQAAVEAAQSRLREERGAAMIAAYEAVLDQRSSQAYGQFLTSFGNEFPGDPRVTDVINRRNNCRTQTQYEEREEQISKQSSERNHYEAESSVEDRLERACRRLGGELGDIDFDDKSYEINYTGFARIEGTATCTVRESREIEECP